MTSRTDAISLIHSNNFRCTIKLQNLERSLLDCLKEKNVNTGLPSIQIKLSKSVSTRGNGKSRILSIFPRERGKAKYKSVGYHSQIYHLLILSPSFLSLSLGIIRHKFHGLIIRNKIGSVYENAFKHENTINMLKLHSKI